MEFVDLISESSVDLRRDGFRKSGDSFTYFTDVSSCNILQIYDGEHKLLISLK